MNMRPIMPLGSKGIRVKLETIEVCSSEDEAETKRKPEKDQEVETEQGPEQENDTSPNSAEEEDALPGYTDDGFDPPAPAWSKDKTPTRLDHWSEGYKNNHKNKHRWSAAFANWSGSEWSRLKAIEPTVGKTGVALHNWGISLNSDLRQIYSAQEFGRLKTLGRWYSIEWKDFEQPKIQQYYRGMDKAKDLRDAYHATSIKALACIVESGEIQKALNCQQFKHDVVFCERQDRMHCSMQYATHNVSPMSDDPLLYACILQLAVDRGASSSRTFNRQWVQTPDTIWIMRVMIHAVNPAHLYTKGYLGWFTLHKSVYEHFANSKMKPRRANRT